MPLITKKPRKIAGKDYEVHIFYSSTRGFYVHKGLPDNMGDFISNLESKISGEPTEEALNKVLSSVISDYEAKIKTDRQVLVINCIFGSETQLLLGYDPFSKAKNIFGARWNHDVKGHGFSLDFCICREFTVGESKDYRQKDSQDNNGRILANGSFFRPDDKSIIIAYSPERADFLMRMAEATKQIAEGLSQFFAQDEALMIDRVEAARLGQTPLLLGSSEQP